MILFRYLAVVSRLGRVRTLWAAPRPCAITAATMAMGQGNGNGGRDGYGRGHIRPVGGMGLPVTWRHGAGDRPVWSGRRRLGGGRGGPCAACAGKLERQEGLPVRQPDDGRSLLGRRAGRLGPLGGLCAAWPVAARARRSRP